MALRVSIAIAAGALLAAGCGQSSETQQASAPADAEKPYTEPSPPPAHVDAAIVDETENSSAPDAAAFRDAAQNTGAESGKVDNVTAAVANELDAIKNVAVADEAENSSGESADDPFGGLVGDPQRGRRLYVQCQACHALVEGQNRVGPTLYNIVGSPAGAVDGFRYSDANANAEITWTEDVLFAYLENPTEYMPGTRMFFPGVARPQDRADIIAYLKTQGE